MRNSPRQSNQQPQPSIGEVLSLLDQFGGTPESVQRQQSGRLAQLAQAVNIGQGVGALQAQPGDIAARRAGEQASLEATQANTNASRTLLPGQVETQAANNAGTRAGTAATTQATEQSAQMHPLQQLLAQLKAQQAGQEVVQGPQSFATDQGLKTAQTKHLGIQGDAAAMQGKAAIAAHVNLLLDNLVHESKLPVDIANQLKAQFFGMDSTINPELQKAAIERKRLAPPTTAAASTATHNRALLPGIGAVAGGIGGPIGSLLGAGIGSGIEYLTH